MSKIVNPRVHRGFLFKQLSWFIQLRWFAGAAVISGAWVDMQWLHWFDHSRWSLLVGVAILFYNAFLWWTLQQLSRLERRLYVLRSLAGTQLLLDMLGLTLLTLWTGGVQSPLTPFYVLHMVFASLLLPSVMAYASAVIVIGLYVGALWWSNDWPDNRVEILNIVGRVLTLIATVHLTNHITRGLRRQRKRLIRQNRRIRAVTGQLQKHQLAMAQHEKMVALGQMAAGVTHEIANPLASMDSLLQLVQRRPERMKPETIVTLREQIERIHQIVQQMKTFAHPDAGQQQTVSLNEIVEQSLHILRFDPRLKLVRVERIFSPSAGTLPLLPQALQQVLVNLIINALDAMSQTLAPVLTLRTERRDGSCVVEVTDNGTGIAPENVGRLFEPFFTTKPVGKGTGLGLSISYSLIQNQGGSISVRTQPNKGTSFIIRLPVEPRPSHLREADGQPVVATEKPGA